MTSRRTWPESARAIETICWAAGRSARTRAPGVDALVAEARKQSGRLCCASGRDQETGPRRDLVGEEDALGDGQVLDEVELLIDRRDAALLHGGRIAERQRLAADDDLAAGRLDRSRHALDQRRLAGAVGAEQAVDLTLEDVEAHALERLYAGILLDQVANLEHLRCVLGGRHQPATSGSRLSTAISSPASILSIEPPHSGSSCSTESTPSKPPARRVST